MIFLMDPEFWARLFGIIIIDLTLAGDNALVIALAVRTLPQRQQFWGRLWGAAGAVGLRLAFIAVATLLLAIPMLQLVGGLLLLWIAFKLVRKETGTEKHVRQGGSLWEAIRIIVLADAIMSLDNVLAVRGRCHGAHIVEAHDRVSQDDDPNRLPERAALTDVLLGPGLLADELERDPEEQQPADELEHRDREEQRRDGDEGQTQPHRTRRAPHAPPELLALGQRAHGERDDERVVAGQGEVDDHDAEEPSPELRIHQEDHRSLHQGFEDRDQEAAHDQERDGDSQAFVTVHSHLVSPCEMDERDMPPAGGGRRQKTDERTGLVVVGGRRGREQGGARRRIGRRDVPRRRLHDGQALAGERIVARFDAALGWRRPDRGRRLVLAPALDVNDLLDFRVPDLEAEGARQGGIGEVEGQIGGQQDQQAARAHALL